VYIKEVVVSHHDKKQAQVGQCRSGPSLFIGIPLWVLATVHIRRGGRDWMVRLEPSLHRHLLLPLSFGILLEGRH
jgi:hypothetical protein